MRDVILTDIDNHMTYEKYLGHEKLMEAVLDTMRELISMEDDVDRETARQCLEKHMAKYFDSGISDDQQKIKGWVASGFQREGEYTATQKMINDFLGGADARTEREAVIGALVDNVLSRWKCNNEEEFNKKLNKFNERRKDYARTGNYKGLLLEYNMGKENQRFLKGAAILHANLGKGNPLSATGVEIPEDKVWDKYISKESYGFIGELIKEGLLIQIRLRTLFADIGTAIPNLPPKWPLCRRRWLDQGARPKGKINHDARPDSPLSHRP
jgi:hypothetical protein